MNDEIDIAAADFTVTLSRNGVVDFLPVLIQSFIQVFIKNPSASRNWASFIKPLTWEAWISIFIFLLLSPPIIYCIFFYGSGSITFTLPIL